MAALVEKLLFIAKGDSGTKSLEKKEFHLNKLIDEVVEDSKLLTSKHKISNNKNDVVKVYADYKMLKQMLRIFIDNSIKFSPENTTIDISSQVQGDDIKLTVSDEGRGIPQDEIDKIFDRFYTVDKSRSKEKGGTGLGLSIAKWIVNMHGGVIKVTSEENRFTKIEVLLNLQKGKECKNG
jgi:signal transduction histidine kinase